MSDPFIQEEAKRILDRLNPDDVGIVTEVLRGSQALLYLLDIETTMILIARPSYNIVIRQSKED